MFGMLLVYPHRTSGVVNPRCRYQDTWFHSYNTISKYEYFKLLHLIITCSQKLCGDSQEVSGT